MASKSLFKKKQQNEGYSNIPSNPEICQVLGCGCGTHIILTQVRDGMGRTLTGSFSRFGDTDRRSLHEGYTFVRFITRCAECYQNDLIRAGHASGLSITNHMKGDIKPQITAPQ